MPVVIAGDDGQLGLLAVVADIAESHILNALAGCGAVLLVPAHLDLQDAGLGPRPVPLRRAGELDADIVEGDVLHRVAVAAVDGQTALIIHLRLVLAEDVDVLITESDDAVAYLRIAVQTDEDGVSHVGPQRGVGHADVAHAAREALAGGIGRGAVVAVAAEHAVEEDIAASAEDVQAVAPLRMRDAAHVVEGHVVAAADGAGVKDEPVDAHVPRAIDMTALVAALGPGDAAPQDADVLGIVDGEGAGEIAAALQIN